jgi:tetratricopeptide (TPR) repeat protein
MSAAPDPSQFFVLGGTLRRDAPSYITRRADEELLKQTLAGEYCNVLAARQMGKSSLMVRTADRLRAAGARAAIIDLTAIGTEVTVDEWYFGLIARLARQLRLQTDEQTWWKARPETSSVQRFSDFVHEVVLQEITEPTVVFIDEIDSTLRLIFTDDFFAAIRAMFNARAEEPAYQRISFVLLGVARPADLIKDRTRTPYNVGVNIDLTDFTFDEAQGVFGPVLEAAHPGQGTDLLQCVLDWTGGQPYLTQKLCADVAAHSTSPLAPVDIDQAVERLFLTDEARKESNLQAIRDRVLSNAHKTPILKLYQKILDGKAVVAEERSIEQNELKLTGLVRATPQGLLVTRNRVYAHVFDKPWVKSNLPVDRSRRVAVAAVVVALLATVVTLMVIANQRDVSAQPLIDQFNNSSSSEVRISSLAGLIKLGETTEAQTLSDNLGVQGWIDLLSPTNLPKPSNVGGDLVLIGDKLYQTVPNTPEGNALLKAAAAALDQAEQPEAVRLSNEIDNWLQGRELAASGKADAALDWFNRTYAASEQRQHANAGVLLDRAGVYAELKQPDRALTDFVVALQLDARLSSAIAEAITRRPELLAFWATNQKGYQQLINILPTLTATPTSTNQPTPTPMPTETPTPVPTLAPTPTPTLPPLQIIPPVSG